MRREAKNRIDDFPTGRILRNFRELNASLRGGHGERLGYGRHGVDQLVHIVERPVNPKVVKGHFCALADRLCSDHPGIETNVNIKGGIPRIKGSRIAVSQILGRIYVLGSIDAVTNYYAPEVSKEQVKAAVSYAQDFLETACEPL